MSSPVNNQPIKKDEVEASFLYITATRADKGSWIQAAQRAKKKLKIWVTETLNKNAK